MQKKTVTTKPVKAERANVFRSTPFEFNVTGAPRNTSSRVGSVVRVGVVASKTKHSGK